MTRRIFTAAVALFLASVAFAGKKKADSDPIFPDVTARGRALYEYDEAAWHSSDALQATNPPKESLGRYVAHKSDTGWTVAFGRLNDRSDKFVVAYEATEGANLKEFTVKKIDPPREDAGFYLSAARAIETALHDFHGENRPYNVAVLPAPSDQLYVYVLPAQTKAGIYPLGGDVRYVISPDGGSIVEKRQLHKSIIELPPSSDRGAKPVAGVHIHVLSNVPEDTDVFHVLTRQPPQPEYVGTPNKKFYEISTDGTIRERKM